MSRSNIVCVSSTRRVPAYYGGLHALCVGFVLSWRRQYDSDLKVVPAFYGLLVGLVRKAYSDV